MSFLETSISQCSHLIPASLESTLQPFSIWNCWQDGERKIKNQVKKEQIRGQHKEAESQYFSFFEADDLFPSQLCCCYSRQQEESFYNVFVHEIITFCILNIL